jgi:hypothetical protein
VLGNFLLLLLSLVVVLPMLQASLPVPAYLPAPDTTTSLPMKLRSESLIVACWPLLLSLSFGAGPPAPVQQR